MVTVNEQIVKLVSDFKPSGFGPRPSTHSFPLLSEGQEWVEPRVLDGEWIYVTYFFGVMEVTAARNIGGKDYASMLNYDNEHIIHITTEDYVVLAEREGE